MLDLYNRTKRLIADEYKNASKMVGKVNLQEDSKGRFEIRRFMLTEDDVLMGNLRAVRNGIPQMICFPGEYTSLVCVDGNYFNNPIMSDTPLEVLTCYDFVCEAKGDILISGLGIGLVLDPLLKKDDVQSITVLEKEQDVIDMVEPYYKNKKLRILKTDVFKYRTRKKYDYAWHDIWSTINKDNLKEMNKIKRKYKSICKKQMFWSKKILESMRY